MSVKEAPPKFPPETKMLYSQRKEQFSTCRFLDIRKGACDVYKKADQSPFMQYHETLGSREETKNKVLEFELSQGWLEDDRGSAQVIPLPATAPQEVVAAPVEAPAAPITTPVVEVAKEQMLTPPPMQDAPTTPPSTTGFKRPAPKALTSAVAPPPPAAVQAAPVAPPFVPQVPPQSTQVAAPAAPIAAPQLMSAPIAAPVVTAPAVAGVSFDAGPLIAKIDSIGGGLSTVSADVETLKNDFKTFVGNLSAQVLETNKSLNQMTATVNGMLVAIHHLYLNNPGLAKAAADATDIMKFRAYLNQYLPANPQ